MRLKSCARKYVSLSLFDGDVKRAATLDFRQLSGHQLAPMSSEDATQVHGGGAGTAEAPLLLWVPIQQVKPRMAEETEPRSPQLGPLMPRHAEKVLKTWQMCGKWRQIRIDFSQTGRKKSFVYENRRWRKQQLLQAGFERVE